MSHLRVVHGGGGGRALCRHRSLESEGKGEIEIKEREDDANLRGGKETNRVLRAVEITTRTILCESEKPNALGLLLEVILPMSAEGVTSGRERILCPCELRTLLGRHVSVFPAPAAGGIQDPVLDAFVSTSMLRASNVSIALHRHAVVLIHGERVIVTAPSFEPFGGEVDGTHASDKELAKRAIPGLPMCRDPVACTRG